MSIKLQIVPINLDNKSLTSSFDCGNVFINNFLYNHSLDENISKTFLLIQNDKIVIGFFSLCCSCLLEKNNDIYTTENPAIEIKMFAIDKNYHDTIIEEYGHTYAHFMLLQCLNLIEKISSNYVGASCCVLTATDDGYPLYKNVGGFEELEDDYMVPDSNNEKHQTQMYRAIR